jgi:site-specific recombinase XerD
MLKKFPLPLWERVRVRGVFEDLRRELVSRKYSYKTVKGYLYYNRDFQNFTGKIPSDIDDNDIKDYLLYLAEEKQSATSTVNQAINALKFYYGSMLKKKFVYEVKRPRKDKKLPVVLSKEEVARILSSIDNVKHRAILMLVYSAGLRVGEVIRLKIEDIDSKRMLVHIKGAKGRKDRKDRKDRYTTCQVVKGKMKNFRRFFIIDLKSMLFSYILPPIFRHRYP